MYGQSDIDCRTINKRHCSLSLCKCPLVHYTFLHVCLVALVADEKCPACLIHQHLSFRFLKISFTPRQFEEHQRFRFAFNQ
ncbi:hypothetical protein T09_15640 [Trichinella sp. T9]|nr:hypothetical protein T09_15640 [Trichinella sp. T9]